MVFWWNTMEPETKYWPTSKSTWSTWMCSGTRFTRYIHNACFWTMRHFTRNSKSLYFSSIYSSSTQVLSGEYLVSRLRNGGYVGLNFMCHLQTASSFVKSSEQNTPGPLVVWRWEKTWATHQKTKKKQNVFTSLERFHMNTLFTQFKHKNLQTNGKTRVCLVI